MSEELITLHFLHYNLISEHMTLSFLNWSFQVLSQTVQQIPISHLSPLADDRLTASDLSRTSAKNTRHAKKRPCTHLLSDGPAGPAGAAYEKHLLLLCNTDGVQQQLQQPDFLPTALKRK